MTALAQFMSKEELDPDNPPPDPATQLIEEWFYSQPSETFSSERDLLEMARLLWENGYQPSLLIAVLEQLGRYDPEIKSLSSMLAWKEWVFDQQGRRCLKVSTKVLRQFASLYLIVATSADDEKDEARLRQEFVARATSDPRGRRIHESELTLCLAQLIIRTPDLAEDPKSAMTRLLALVDDLDTYNYLLK